ncbi:DNA-directed RNA polymerase III subunit RPC3-like [Littorina saxatilis]|uniref:DNA-directed RNA polymerase III subunit RPC3 n=1 Tax=Littorina saxatilis TaxID=31220 RepID=A0AAN9C3W2_9CAEN
MSKTDLALLILRDFHGEIVAKIGECIVLSGCATVRQVALSTGIPQAKVKRAVLILVQHGIAEFEQNKHGFIDYKVDVNKIVYRLQFPKIMRCAELLYGDPAKFMVEKLLFEGRATMKSLIKTETQRLNECLRAQGDSEVAPSLLEERFEKLVKTHFLKRCSVPIKDARGRAVSLEAPSEELVFVMPPKESGTERVKQEGEPPSKKLKVEGEVDHAAAADSATSEIYWEVNYKRFLQHFRDQVLVAAVASRLDNEKAGEVLRTILRHCEKTTNPNEYVSQPISYHEIQAQLPRDLGMAKQTLEQWLKILTDTMPEFVSKSADSGGGMYAVSIFQALQTLCTAHIESVVEERFGSKSLRIFRVILMKRQVEQTTIEKCVLMPAKEAKDLLYKMFREHFVHVTELAKTPDHAPSRTFYLFNVDLQKVARVVLDRSYKAMKNVVIKQRLVVSENKRLRDKENRKNVVIASLQKQHSDLLAEHGEGITDEMKEEWEREVDAIKSMITHHEYEQLEKASKFIHHLEASQQQLDSTIFLLESYLAMTYKPPTPKPARDPLGR